MKMLIELIKRMSSGAPHSPTICLSEDITSITLSLSQGRRQIIPWDLTKPESLRAAEWSPKLSLLFGIPQNISRSYRKLVFISFFTTAPLEGRLQEVTLRPPGRSKTRQLSLGLNLPWRPGPLFFTSFPPPSLVFRISY